MKGTLNSVKGFVTDCMHQNGIVLSSLSSPAFVSMLRECSQQFHNYSARLQSHFTAHEDSDPEEHKTSKKLNKTVNV